MLALPANDDGYGFFDLAFSPDGRHVVTGSGPLVEVWDSESGVRLAALREHRHHVVSVSYAPDGSGILSLDDHGGVVEWSRRRPESRLGWAATPTFWFAVVLAFVTGQRFRRHRQRIRALRSDDARP